MISRCPDDVIMLNLVDDIIPFDFDCLFYFSATILDAFSQLMAPSRQASRLTNHVGDASVDTFFLQHTNALVRREEELTVCR
jgi:hypothetical protein